MSASAPEKDVVPPSDTFWQRYSSHFELPLATMSSLLIHAAVFGILFVGGIWALLNWGRAEAPPPNMIPVELTGDGTGDRGGNPNAGGGSGGVENPKNSAEIVQPSAVASENAAPKNQPKLQVDPIDINVATNTDTIDPSIFDRDISKTLEQLGKEPIVAPAPAKTNGQNQGAGNNPNGAGGLGTKGKGKGDGTGTGTGPGSQPGVPGGGGEKKSQSQIYAERWKFELKGSAKEHADKLANVGFMIGFQQGNNFMTIQNVKERPVRPKADNPAKYKNAVLYFNSPPGRVSDTVTLADLARELKLPNVPSAIALILPQDRERIIADEETRFAIEKNHDQNRITATWFDFRLQDGVYVPLATKQETR